MPTPDGWDTWSKFIRAELERLGESSSETRKEIAASSLETRKEIAAIYKEIANINAQLSSLKTQAGLWGAIGASIPIMIMLAIQVLMR